MVRSRVELFELIRRDRRLAGCWRSWNSPVSGVVVHVIPQGRVHVIPHWGVSRLVLVLVGRRLLPFSKLRGARIDEENVQRGRCDRDLVHWHAGRSLSEIAESLGVDRKTVRKYVASAVASSLLPGGRAKSAAQWAELVRAWFPSLVETRLRQITWPEIDKHRDFIVAMLTAGVTKQTIWQRLRDEHGLVASVSSLKRYIDGNLPEEGLRTRVTVLPR